MPDLTDMQADFVAAFTSEPGCIGNATKAALHVGYSAKSAREIGRQQLVKPRIRAAIDEALREQLGGSLASKAVDVLREIIHDESSPQKLRLDAARTVLDRAGIIAPKAMEPTPAGSKADLASMSLEELATFIQQGEERQRQIGAIDAEGTITAPLLGPP